METIRLIALMVISGIAGTLVGEGAKNKQRSLIVYGFVLLIACIAVVFINYAIKYS